MGCFFSSPECIAWYNGSFAPPTNAHIETALMMAKKLVLLNPNKRCRFCIVPVSNAHKKASVQNVEEEYPNLRKQLCRKFVEILKERALKMPEFYNKTIDFVFETHEIDSPTPINPYDSVVFLQKKYNLQIKDIFIAQGQDNVDDFLNIKGWTLLPDLLYYPVILAPRNNLESEDDWKQNKRNFMLSSDPPYDRIEDYLENLYFVEFNKDMQKYLDHSSTFIRELLRQTSDDILQGKISLILSYIHTDILNIIISNIKKGSVPYTSIMCEKNGVVDIKIKTDVTQALRKGF
jgi:nicotinic acid mononucleotide adenylyltransferase